MNTISIKLIVTGLLTLILGASLYYFLTINKQQNNEIVVSEQNSKITNEIDEATEISGSLQGYYYSYVKTGEYVDVPFNETCDAFVVKDGDENGKKIRDYFLNLVKTGNTVNSISKNNELIINLDANDVNRLNLIDKEKLKSSSDTKVIVIQVKKLIQEGKDASPCYSFVDLYGVSAN